MRRRRWTVLGSVLGALVLLAAVPVLLTMPLPSGSLVTVADRFKPGSVATFDGGSQEPRRLWCLGDNECPSLSRGWQLERPVSSDEVQEWLDRAGYDVAVDGDCATGRCSASGTADGWVVYVFVSVDDLTGAARLRLSLH